MSGLEVSVWFDCCQVCKSVSAAQAYITCHVEICCCWWHEFLKTVAIGRSAMSAKLAADISRAH